MPPLDCWLKPLLAGVLVGALVTALLFGGTRPAMAVGRAGGADVAEVVEHLRVKVPADAVEAWLEAERGSWEPWLAQQPGFLDRQVLWDPQREEGTLLIHWRSRAQWRSIPQGQVEQVQDRFEQLARQATGTRQGNPFPLVFEGELLPQ